MGRKYGCGKPRNRCYNGSSGELVTNKITNIFGTVALGLSVANGLLVCEVIRPFHEFFIDGSIALSFGVRRSDSFASF